MAAPITLFKAPTTRYRSDATRGRKASGVDREGGEGFGAILGASMIVQGEALGHDMWIDTDFLKEVAEAIQLTGNQGIKARFAHPDMSGDGIGTGLGRIKGGEFKDDHVTADLIFSAASHKAPKGNLADYLMTLADTEPDHFGFSIVFERDVDAENEFREANSEEFTFIDRYTGEEETGRRFKSPDEKNTKNLRHVRLKKLNASDAVDTPAANPNGLYYSEKNSILDTAEKGLSYLLGLTEDAPEQDAFGIHPERARSFFARFLDSRNLSIVDATTQDKGAQSSASNDTPNIPKSMDQEQFDKLSNDLAELKAQLAASPAPAAEPVVEPAPVAEKPAALTSEPSRAEALAALGLTEDQYSAQQAAKAKADADAESAKLSEAIRKEMALAGLKAPAAASGATDTGKEEEVPTTPQSWSAAVEADKTLAKGLSFEEDWTSGKVTLASLPDNQDAFTLLRRAERDHGKESAFQAAQA